MNQTVLTRVTDSMGDHWTYAGVSIYPTRDVFVVPALTMLVNPNDTIFPSLDAAVDAIRTHLQPEGR